MQNMTQKPTIGEIVKGDLCTGCGTCVSLCPNGAIELVIDDKKGICVPKLNVGIVYFGVRYKGE
ncbi:MAG: 4Fe-4S binding protein [Halobacteriota archaeon]